MALETQLTKAFWRKVANSYPPTPRFLPLVAFTLVPRASLQCILITSFPPLFTFSFFSPPAFFVNFGRLFRLLFLFTPFTPFPRLSFSHFFVSTDPFANCVYCMRLLSASTALYLFLFVLCMVASYMCATAMGRQVPFAPLFRYA